MRFNCDIPESHRTRILHITLEKLFYRYGLSEVFDLIFLNYYEVLQAMGLCRDYWPYSS